MVTFLRWTRIAAGVLVAAGIVAAEAAAEPDSAQHDGALWIVNQATLPLDERFSFHGMVQNRWTGDVDVYQRTVLRPWLRMQLPHGFSASLGYDAHLFEGPSSIAEQRAWQRVSLRRDLGPIEALGHVWMEERFFRGESVAFRARLSVGGAVALPFETQLVARNEFFFDLNPTSRIRARKLGEDQLVVALGRAIAPRVRLDAGYLMQFLDGPRDLYNHTFTVGFSVTAPRLSEWGSNPGKASTTHE